MGETQTLVYEALIGQSLQEGIAAAEELCRLEAQWLLPAAEAPHDLVRESEADTAEDWVSKEEYAHSLRLLELLGAAALEKSLDTGEGARLKEIARDEWKSCLVEMLNTDAEFRKRLEVTRERAYEFRNGHVVCSDAEGNITPIVDLVERGARRSAQEAEADPLMQFQAERDRNDLYNAREVDKLEPGMMRIVVSMDPKAAFKKYGREYVERLGYRQGWASIQGYWRTPDGGELTALTYTVNNSDMTILRGVCNEAGAAIPETVSEDSFIRYAITVSCTDMDSARAALTGIRDASYRKQGITDRRYSVDEFLSLNSELVDQVFDTQYIALAAAHKRKLKDETIQIFAKTLLQSPRGIGPRAQAQLRDIYRKPTLQDGDVRLMDYLLRYGLVERLRPALNFLGSKERAKIGAFGSLTHIPQQEYIARSLAGNMLDGIRAGRTYGGCARGLDLIGDSKDGDTDERDPLDAFGGNDAGTSDSAPNRRSWKLKWDICRVQSCPSRGSDPKRPLRVLCGPCGVCMSRCQRIFDAGKDPTSARRTEWDLAG